MESVTPLAIIPERESLRTDGRQKDLPRSSTSFLLSWTLQFW
jgi:hypothetical protein